MMRRLAATGAALVLAVLAVPSPVFADPLPIGQCTTSAGVVLAVDFSRWGGPLLRACGTTPTTGYQLLNQGGWKTTGTQHDGPAFICRIGYSGYSNGTQYPTAADEKCVLTPPASAYWSYWHADAGTNTWVYSQLGAMSYKPKPGSVDLWIFGATNIEGTEGRPTFSPDSVRARNTAPVDTAPATTAPPPAARTSGPAAPGGGPPAGADPAGVDPPPSTVDTSPSPAGPASAAASPSVSGEPDASGTGGPAVVDAVPTRAAAPAGSSGSATPLLVTLGVLVLLGAGAATLAWRRRRARATPPW